MHCEVYDVDREGQGRRIGGEVKTILRALTDRGPQKLKN